MKQTLFLLAALAVASTAAAETTWTQLDNVTLSYDGEGWGDSTYLLNALTFDFCITKDSMTEGKVILAYVATDYVTDSYEDQITFTLENVGDSYTLRAGLSNYTSEVNDLFDSSFSGSITGLQENVVYTLSSSPIENSSYSRLTLTGDDGSSFKTLSFTSHLNKSETVTDAVISADVAMINAAFAVSVNEPAASIPEPTTATLSLLALAGLAARRRRK